MGCIFDWRARFRINRHDDSWAQRLQIYAGLDTRASLEATLDAGCFNFICHVECLILVRRHSIDDVAI